MIVIAHDAIHVNVHLLPPGQAAGYTTGSPDIRWTPGDWAAKPGAVRIDQDFAAADPSADVLDVERGAATPAEAPIWANKATEDFNNRVRPGQRKPAIYMSQSMVSDVVNSMIRWGLRGGVGLWVANWNLSQAQAMAEVSAAAGPFPVIGIQWTDRQGPFDSDVFSSNWLGTVSGGKPPVPQPPTIQVGSTGPWVHLAQVDLNRHAASPQLVTDGIFGARTLRAVEAFQSRSGLVVDGIVGPATWAKLAA